MVDNGSHLQCQDIFNNVQIYLQEKLFTQQFYLFLTKGVDVVLCMTWLRTLGPLQADF